MLEGLEAVRKRPGMYIGSTGERGLHHLVWEVVDNSVDEALAGYCDRIEVTLLADGGVRVADNGRGIPVDMHPQPEEARGRGRPHRAARRRQVRRRRPTRSPAACTASASRSSTRCRTRLEVEIERDGFHWYQPYVDQKPAAPLNKGEPTSGPAPRSPSGPTTTIFETIEYSFETISRRLQEMAFLNKGLTIVLRDERAEKVVDEDDADGRAPRSRSRPKEITYRYQGGIADFVRHINRTKDEPIHKDVIYFEDEDTRAHDVASRSRCSGTPAYAESVHTFANTINTIEGGTHEEGFRAALTNVVNKWAIEQEDHQGHQGGQLTGDDIREGLAAIISIKLGEPQFEGQTKTKLGNSSAKTFVQPVCNDRLGRVVRAQPGRGQDDRHAR